MHRIMNRAIREYEERVIESQQLLERNTEFARELSEGENPEPYEEMMETRPGQSAQDDPAEYQVQPDERSGNRAGSLKGRIWYPRFCGNTRTWRSFPTRS